MSIELRGGLLLPQERTKVLVGRPDIYREVLWFGIAVGELRLDEKTSSVWLIRIIASPDTDLLFHSLDCDRPGLLTYPALIKRDHYHAHRNCSMVSAHNTVLALALCLILTGMILDYNTTGY